MARLARALRERPLLRDAVLRGELTARKAQAIGRVVGASSPRWRRVEALCEEDLGAHPVEPGDDEGPSDGLVRADTAFLQEDAPSMVRAPTARSSRCSRSRLAR